MRYSPATGVHADEVRAKGMHYLPGHDASYPKEAGVLFLCEFMPPGNMSLWDDQRVAFAEGIDIQDAYRQIILVDLISLPSTGHNIAKYAGLLSLFWHIYADAAWLENANDYFNKEAFQASGVVYHVIPDREDPCS
jgi:hypothetical protein